MPGIFEGLFLISDIDGTFIDSDCRIPKNNLEAVDYFRANGGRFSLATGRSQRSAKRFLDEANVTEPSIHYNGGGVYNNLNDENSDMLFLPPSAKEYLKNIQTALPFTGIVIVTANSDYNAGGNDVPNKYIDRNEELNGLMKKSLDDIEESWVKALICHEPPLKQQVYEYLTKNAFSGVDFISSSAHFVEMLPPDCSKGAALKKMAKRLGIEQKNIIAIGDYYNDISMIEFAGLGAAVANARQDVKDAAGYITCGCNDGAVADLIGYIEKNIKNLK